jgi:tetratricopeptide (TPR) repeat protein
VSRVDIPLELAERLWRQGRVDSAVAACHDALGIDASDAAVHALLSELYLTQDFYEEAIAAASRAIEIDPSCAPALLTLGLAYDRRGGLWDRSVLVWQELSEVNPDFVTAHVQLGEALSVSGFEAEAIEAWKSALLLDPRCARAMYDLAIAAVKAEGMATALPGFRKAGELDASQDDFFFELAGVDRARSSTALAGAAADRDGWLRCAYALASEEDFLAAAGYVRRILDGDPDDAEALGLAGYLYLRQGAANEAMAVCLRALVGSSRTPTAVYVLGDAFARQGGLARNAARVFGALAKAVPASPMPQVLHGECLLALQRYRDASTAFTHAVRIDPTLVRARFGLAAALLVEGEYSRAQHEIMRAAYYDTREAGSFVALWADYLAGRDLS